MSQAWSQFASKDLGVPKGKIKKEKKETTCRKQRNAGTKLCYFPGGFAPSKELYPMAHCNAGLLNLFFSPRAGELPVITRARRFQARRGYRGHRSPA